MGTTSNPLQPTAFQLVYQSLRPVNRGRLSLKYFTKSVLFNPKYGVPVAGLLLLAEVILSLFIIQRVPYTEIDWKAYMQEVGGFLSGETDYMNLKGDTGPLVYPAGFVYVYSLFYKLLNAGTNILAAQYLFAGFYVLQQALVFAIYVRARLPPYLMMFLVLSKRIHSISLLRLFNDPIAMLPLHASILAFTYNRYLTASLLYSLALSIKMNILLPLPAFALLTLSRTSFKTSLQCLFLIITTQITLSLPFTLSHPASYINRAFEFSRVFAYKWSVNWKFVSEGVFLRPMWAKGLLVLHVGVLLAFAIGRWNTLLVIKRLASDLMGSKSSDSVGRKRRRSTDPALRHPAQTHVQTLEYVGIATLIGITFARSLHYQFYSWYFHFIPFLLYRAKLSFSTTVLFFTLIEYAWNKYPSTAYSSAVLFAIHVILLGKLWIETRRNGMYKKLK